MRVAGVMSGTSLDGIDVAVVEIRGARVDTVGFLSTPYPARVRDAILAVSNTVTHTAAISRLSYELGELYARAVLRAVKRHGAIELIGCHAELLGFLGEPGPLGE